MTRARAIKTLIRYAMLWANGAFPQTVKEIHEASKVATGKQPTQPVKQLEQGALI